MVDSVYEGQVDQDEIEQGLGRYSSKLNGDIYEGEWKNGFYHGYGRMIYGKNHEVDYYMGHWKTGRKHGIGLQILKDGTVQ